MAGRESLCRTGWSQVSKFQEEINCLVLKSSYSSYRMIVLRALPNLTKLDNEDVSPEEVNEAMRAAVRREEPVYEEQYQEPVPQPSRQQQEYRQTSPIREASRTPDPLCAFVC